MANRYWVGGTAAWDGTAGTKWATTSGGAGGAAVPTAADDVFFDAASGAVTVTTSTGKAFRSINFTGFTGTMTWSGGNWTIGDATAGAGNIALKLVAGMTLNIAGAGALNFVSTSATQQTIDTGGKSVPVTNIINAGCSYLLAANFTTTGIFTHSGGTFNTGGFNITCTAFNYGNNLVRTLTLGSSTITTSASGNNFTGTAVTNLTVTANTATIIINGTIGGQNNAALLAGKDWNGLSLTINTVGQYSINIGGTSARLHNIIINGTAVQTTTCRLVNISGTFTITGQFEVNGNSALNRPLVFNAITGTSVTISAATSSLNNVDFMDIVGGGAASWAITSGVVGDWGGNSGITFTTPATQTRDSTNGQAWSVAARWTSRVPLPQDDVIIDGSSGNISATDVLIFGKTIDFTGYTGTITQTSNGSNFSIFGSLIFSTGMSFGAGVNTFNLDFRGRGNYVITSNGKTFFPFTSNQTITVIAPTGTYTLTDTFNQTPSLAVGNYTFAVTAGTFDSANQTMNIGRFITSGTTTRSVLLGTSILNLMMIAASSIISIVTTGQTLDATNATFNIVNATANTRSIALGGAWIGTLNYTLAGSTGTLSITSSGVMSVINFSDANNARTLQFSAGVSLTVFTFNVTGTAGKLMTVASATTTVAYLSSPLTLFNSSQDYIAYSYMQVNQPLSLWCATNSTASNCIGIYATEPTYKHGQSGAATTTGTSISGSFILPPIAGDLLIAYFSSSNSQGTFTPPAGWSQAVTNTNGAVLHIYYKVADGTESMVTFAQTISRTLNLTLVDYTGFSGSPTLDVTDTNVSVGSGTSLSTTAGSPPSNTDQPAIAVAMIANPSALAATVSVTNDFVEDRTLTNTSTTYKGAVKELTTLAPVDTTFTWTTARSNTAAALAVFKDVAVAPSNNSNFFAFF